jgi:choline dehydrogenase-like flavoprotein
VITGILTQKILLDKSDAGLNANGVEAVLDGQVQTFHASKEVILAAGVFNTPKLLEISGIGQSEILKQHNITQLLELPGVGENLQDHLMTGVSYEVNEGIVTSDPLM